MSSARRSLCGGWALAALALAGCRAPVVDGVPRLLIDHPDTYWQHAGFQELVPPLALPTLADASLRTRVFMRLPDHGLLRVTQGKGGPVVEVPPGTVADRLDDWSPDPQSASPTWTVADVRGTRFDASGAQHFRIFRPEGPGVGRPLLGFEWPRSDAALGQRATGLMTSAMEHGAGFVVEPRDDVLPGAIQHYQGLARCAGCHMASQPAATLARDAVHRGTDASGLYSVISVLDDAGPLETYRPRDDNLDSPYVSLSCPGGAAVARTVGKNGLAQARCADGAVVQARLDVAGALRAGDPRAQAVCASRRYLAAHLDPAGRRVFASALQACGIPLQGG